MAPTVRAPTTRTVPPTFPETPPAEGAAESTRAAAEQALADANARTGYVRFALIWLSDTQVRLERRAELTGRCTATHLFSVPQHQDLLIRCLTGGTTDYLNRRRAVLARYGQPRRPGAGA